MTDYKKLEVWKQSMDIVEAIYELTKKYPIDERYGLTGQTRRAAVSIPSNIAEGVGRNHRRDTIQFLHIARGSMYELETLMDIAIMIQIADVKEVDLLKIKLTDCIKLINGLINYFENTLKAPK